MEIKKTIEFSMLLALSIILSILESFIPIFNGIIPGIKLGLANIVVIYILYKYSFKDALYISILRVFLVSILRTGLFSINFYFSVVGALLSVIFMYLFKKTKLSITGVSIIGAVFHSIGQLIVASILLKNINILYYLPYLLLFSLITGIIIGQISKSVIKKINNNL